jgi:CRISPR system Cascade subunit CasE
MRRAAMIVTHIEMSHPLPRSIQATHALVAAATSGAQGRTMWCSDQPTRLIVQTGHPVLAASIPGALSARSRPAWTGYQAGDGVYLSLIGCPAKRDAPRSGKIRSLPVDEHEGWLRRKIGHAIDLADVAVQPMGAATGWRNGVRLTQARAGFYARGTVRDPDALTHLILTGVGRGKAYGAGLLLVGPA